MDWDIKGVINVKKIHKIIIPLVLCLILLISGNQLSQANELTLEESIEIAKNNNLNILMMEYDIKMAETGIKSAEAASMPTLSFLHSYTRQKEQDFDLPEGEIDIPDGPSLDFDFEEFEDELSGALPMLAEEMFYTELSGQYPLYTGGRLDTAVKQAETGFSMAGLQYKSEIISLAAEVAESYFSVLQAQAGVDLSREFLEQAEEFLKLTKDQYEAGMVTRSDVLQAEAEKSGVERSLRQAETGLEMAKRNFTYLLGLSPHYDFKLAEVELDDYDLPVSKQNALQTARENNPDLLLLERNKDLAEYGIDMAEAEKKPNVFVGGDYTWQDTEWGLDNGSWSLNIGLNYDIFDGGARDAEIESAHLEREQLDKSYEYAVEGIEMGVDQIYYQLVEIIDTAEFLEQQKKAALENLDLTTVRYEADLVTALEVTSAQTELRQTEMELIQHKYEFLTIQATLAELMGYESIHRLH